MTHLKNLAKMDKKLVLIRAGRLLSG